MVTAVKTTLLFPFAVVMPLMPGTSENSESCQSVLYEMLTSPPPPSAAEKIVGGTAGAVGGVAAGTVGAVGGVVGGVGQAVGGALGGLFGGGKAEEEEPAPAE